MRKYNFIRPIMIILVAILVNNIATNISLAFGATPEAASNVGYTAMLIAAVITFVRLNKGKRKS